MKGQDIWMPIEILQDPPLLEEFLSKAAKEMHLRFTSLHPDALLRRYEVEVEDFESLLEYVQPVFVKYQVPDEKRWIFIFLVHREYLAWRKKKCLSYIKV